MSEEKEGSLDDEIFKKLEEIEAHKKETWQKAAVRIAGTGDLESAFKLNQAIEEHHANDGFKEDDPGDLLDATTAVPEPDPVPED